MRLLAFLRDHREVEDARIDFKLVDELTLLVDQFLLKLALLRIIELLRTHHEVARVLGAVHGA